MQQKVAVGASGGYQVCGHTKCECPSMFFQEDLHVINILIKYALCYGVEDADPGELLSSSTKCPTAEEEGNTNTMDKDTRDHQA